MANQKADVLLVGDSSLLYGIKPADVAAAHGGLSYNYGMVGPAFSFNPEAVIDRYLNNNRKPRTIVVYLSPWNAVTPGDINDPQWFPLAVLTTRYGGPADYLALFRARPSAIVEIPPAVVRATGYSAAQTTQLREQMEADSGHFAYADLLDQRKRAMNSPCRPAAQATVPAASSAPAFAALKRKYAARQIKLFVYIAPSAQCDGHIDAIRRSYAGVADNMPAALPDSLFADDNPAGQHVHVNADGVSVASRMLGHFLAETQTRTQMVATR